MRLYPLNGDIPVNKLFNSFREEIAELGSKTGNVNINTPKNHKKVAEFIKSTKGTADPILEVVYGNGAERTLRSNSFTERIPVNLEKNKDLAYNAGEIIDQIKDKEEINDTSVDNKIIYLESLGRIKKKLK